MFPKVRPATQWPPAHTHLASCRFSTPYNSDVPSLRTCHHLLVNSCIVYNLTAQYGYQWRFLPWFHSRQPLLDGSRPEHIAHPVASGQPASLKFLLLLLTMPWGPSHRPLALTFVLRLTRSRDPRLSNCLAC